MSDLPSVPTDCEITKLRSALDFVTVLRLTKFLCEWTISLTGLTMFFYILGCLFFYNLAKFFYFILVAL